MKISRFDVVLFILLALLFFGWIMTASPFSPWVFPQHMGMGKWFGGHRWGQMGRMCPMRGMMRAANPNSTNGNKWNIPSDAANLKNPFHGKDAVEEGKIVFNQNCASCHGTSGKGNGPAAMALMPPPANLVSDQVQNQPDGVLFWKIKNGNPPMPAFNGVLPDSKIWKVVLYLRSLKQHQKGS